MIWLALVRRFWPYLAASALIVGASWYVRHAGYEAGYAASESQWRPRFEAADKARSAANARATALETASMALSAQYEARHAETLQTLNARAADSQRRISGLMRELAASTRCGEMSEAGRSASLPDGPTASDQFFAVAGSDLVEIARRCEADAAQLAALQSWVKARDQLLEVPE